MERVLFSANTSWYLYNFRASTLRAFLEAGYDVVCLAPKDEYSARLSNELGVRWVPLQMEQRGSNLVQETKLITDLWRHYREIQPSVICHFTIKNNVYGTWAANLLGIPCVNTIPGLGFAFTQGGLVPGVARLLYRLSQHRASHVFCQNAANRRTLVQSNIVPDDKLQLLPGSGVNLDRFFPPAHRVRRPDNQPLRLLFASRMLYEKGLPELRSAIEVVNRSYGRCELWLAGFTEPHSDHVMSEAELEAWATQPEVSWLGQVTRVETVLKQVDAVVLPTYYGEGVPKILLEACATGLPIIATDIPGCSSILEDGHNGLVCRPRDVPSLVDAIERMIAMPEGARLAMGRAGRRLVEDDFCESRVVEATLQAVERASRPREASLATHPAFPAVK